MKNQEQTASVVKINPEEYGLEKPKANELTVGLAITLKERKPLIDEFNELSKVEVTEESIPKFRGLRLRIVKNRTEGINKWHKTAKDYFLKGGQFVDAIKRQEVAVNSQMEEKLMDAEKHFENLEKDRLVKVQDQRVKQLSKYVEDAHERDLSGMDDDVWKAFFSTKKQQHEDRIAEDKKADEERKEKTRILNLHNDRKELLIPYWNFISNENKQENYGDLGDKIWQTLLNNSKSAKKDHETEQKKIADENEKLRKQAEEKKLRDEKRNNELRPYIIFIKDYTKLLNLNEKEYQKEFADIKRGAEEYWEFEREESKREAAEKELQEKRYTEISPYTIYGGHLESPNALGKLSEKEYQALLKAKKEASDKGKEETRKRDEEKRIADQEKKRKLDEKNARLAPDKTKLENLAAFIQAIEMPEVKSEEAEYIVAQTQELLNKTSSYILKKVETL